MDVNWGNTLVFKKKNEDTSKIDIEKKLWTSIVHPRKVLDIVGNKRSIDQVNTWFLNRKMCDTSKCLLIHGPSGVGKSTVIQLVAEHNGFHLVHTHADIQRTSQKMNNLFRRASVFGKKGVLVLDDAETFIHETSGTRFLSKMLRSKEKREYGIVIIVNEIDSSLESIRDISTLVKFDNLNRTDTYKIFQRISSRVQHFSYIPPMASYFISGGATGNVMQAVNQLQLLYQGTEKPVPKGRKRKHSLGNVQVESKKDSSMHMWATTYKRSSIDHIVSGEDMIETMMNMNIDFMNLIGRNVYKEYLNYFGNGSCSSIEDLEKCILHMSIADIHRPENHQDRLYSSENSTLWVQDDLNFAVQTLASINILKGRKKYPEMTGHVKKSNKRFHYKS